MYVCISLSLSICIHVYIYIYIYIYVGGRCHEVDVSGPQGLRRSAAELRAHLDPAGQRPVALPALSM